MSTECMEPTGAFDTLAATLDKVEREGGVPQKSQDLWSDKERISIVKQKLLKLGGLTVNPN